MFKIKFQATNNPRSPQQSVCQGCIQGSLPLNLQGVEFWTPLQQGAENRIAFTGYPRLRYFLSNHEDESFIQENLAGNKNFLAESRHDSHKVEYFATQTPLLRMLADKFNNQNEIAEHTIIMTPRVRSQTKEQATSNQSMRSL